MLRMVSALVIGSLCLLSVASNPRKRMR
uniref:Uncharacterized protein n=1 Tax=Arundo donax TaxID=35708 RepID=A0A0A8ZEH6_ARUDO